MNSAKKHKVLEVQQLSIGYEKRSTPLLISKDIDFSAHKGELLAVVGGNGVGKSTLLRTLAKVQPLLQGRIAIEGRDIQDLNLRQLAQKISLVLTEILPTKNLTVKELIVLGRQPHTNWIGTLSEEDIAKVEHAIHQVEIVDLLDKRCYELSDGQLQRVMITRALAQDTDIIILDEPTTHLDIYHKAKILKLLKDIAHRSNKLVIFSSHEIDIAIQLCDNMLVMQESKTVHGSPKELIKSKSFDHLFPEDLILFDSNTESFKMKS